MVDSRSPVGSDAAQAYAPGRLTTLKGKYVLERRLADGGMAEVFLGRTIGAEGFSRPVAIKRVLEGLSRNPTFADLFIAEAQLCSRLQHPNIVSVLDFDRDAEDRLFLVMELVDGVDLRALMDTGRLPITLVIHLALEVLRGLDHAHELPVNADGMRGLVHRDMSPHNVLLSWAGAVKVSDFGIAKVRAATSASASIMIKGKPLYMSPEQINARPLDGRSDLFAVGTMMFEMLCGVHPFNCGTPEEILGHVLHQEVSPIQKLRPDVPDDLSVVVASLLTRELDFRMRSAEAAIAALVACESCPKAGREELIDTLSQRFAGRAPVRARGRSHASHSDPTVVGRSTQVLRPPGRTSTSNLGAISRQSYRWVWAVLAAFLVVGGAVCVLMLRGEDEKPAAIGKPSASERVLPERAQQTASDPLVTVPPLTSPPPAAAVTPPPGAPPVPHGSITGAASPALTPAATAPPRQPSQAPAHPRPPTNKEGIKEIRL